MTNELITFGSQIKALGDKRFGGYLVRWNAPNETDLHGEYFNAETDFMLDDYPLKGLRVLFHHGLTDELGVEPTGEIDTFKMDEYGLWVEGIYAEHRRYIEYVKQMIKDGVLSFSSGALPQGVKTAKTGHIKRWPIIEASLTHTPADWRSAVDAEAGTMVIPLKALREVLKDVDLPHEEAQVDTANGDNGASVDAQTAKADELVSTEEQFPIGEKTMTPEQIRELAAALASELRASGVAPAVEEPQVEAVVENVVADVVEPDAVVTDEMRAEVIGKTIQHFIEKATKDRGVIQNAISAAKTAAFEANPQPVSKTNGAKYTGQVTVSESRKYANLSANQMMVGYLMMEAAKNPKGLNLPSTAIVSEEYLTTMAHKAQREIINKERTGMFAVQDADAVKSAVPWKADELNATNIVTQGAEWVGTLAGTTLWERARTNRILDDLLRKGVWEIELGQGEGSTSIPTEGADPIAYTASEANSLDITGRPEVTANISPFKTGSIDVTPREVKIATAYTVMLEEDSVIRLAPQVERQLNEKAQETIEYIVINGDTATAANTNINLIDGTPATGLYKPAYLATDGMLKNALVTNTSMSRDAGGSLSVSDFQATLALFPDEIANRISNIAFVANRGVEYAARMLPELLTWSAAGDRSTIYSGTLPPFFGVEMLNSGQLPLANTAGKVSATAANNIRGRILAFYAPYWALVWKRRITIESDRDILSGTNIYVLSMRFALAARSGSASAVSYNVGV